MSFKEPENILDKLAKKIAQLSDESGACVVKYLLQFVS